MRWRLIFTIVIGILAMWLFYPFAYSHPLTAIVLLLAFVVTVIALAPQD